MRSTEYEKWIDGQLSMMKNSSLLKWTNNKNNKNKNGNKNWIHPPETLQGGHIVYLVKFLGSTEVSQSKGIEVVKEAITKLRFNQQIKKTEGAKTPKVELTISVDGVAVQQPKSKKVLYQYPLHQISYCADDKAEKRFFSFIAKESDREAHTCFVFISDKLAEEITLTIGQAFDLAYRKFLETSTREGELRRQLMTLRQQLQLLEKEKSTLEDRLKQVAALKDRQDLSRYMEENGISDLLFMNGVQSTEEPILHSPSGSSSDHSNPEPISPLNLPPVPPRNNSKGDILENHENSNEDDFDFDPRAEERKASQSHDVIGNGSASPDSMNGFASDEDDFDPRAEENESNNRKVFGTENSFEIKSPSLELNGIANSFPTLIPPPSRPRQQDKLIPNHLLDGEVDPFSSPLPADNVFSSQIEQIKAGFSRGLSFGTADNDFTLDSLDPLKN